MSATARVWVDFNARENGHCWVPVHRFGTTVGVDAVVNVYDIEDDEMDGYATVVDFDLDRKRIYLDVDWDSLVSPGTVSSVVQSPIGRRNWSTKIAFGLTASAAAGLIVIARATVPIHATGDMPAPSVLQVTGA